MHTFRNERQRERDRERERERHCQRRRVNGLDSSKQDRYWEIASKSKREKERRVAKREDSDRERAWKRGWSGEMLEETDDKMSTKRCTTLSLSSAAGLCIWLRHWNSQGWSVPLLSLHAASFVSICVRLPCVLGSNREVRTQPAVLALWNSWRYMEHKLHLWVLVASGPNPTSCFAWSTTFRWIWLLHCRCCCLMGGGAQCMEAKNIILVSPVESVDGADREWYKKPARRPERRWTQQRSRSAAAALSIVSNFSVSSKNGMGMAHGPCQCNAEPLGAQRGHSEVHGGRLKAAQRRSCSLPAWHRYRHGRRDQRPQCRCLLLQLLPSQFPCMLDVIAGTTWGNPLSPIALRHRQLSQLRITTKALRCLSNQCDQNLCV